MIHNRIPLKMLKRTPREKIRMRQIKKIRIRRPPMVDGTFTKNIVFKKVLTP